MGKVLLRSGAGVAMAAAMLVGGGGMAVAATPGGSAGGVRPAMYVDDYCDHHFSLTCLWQEIQPSHYHDHGAEGAAGSGL